MKNNLCSKKRTSGGEVLWLDDPNVLVQSADLFPVPRQTETEKLNAVTRLLFLVSLGVFVYTRSIGTLLLGFLCALGLAMLHTAWLFPGAAAVFTTDFDTSSTTTTSCSAGGGCGGSGEEKCIRRPPNEGFVAAANDPTKEQDEKEEFESSSSTSLQQQQELGFLESVKAAVQGKDGGEYQRPTAVNPFGNLLQSDAMLRPGRKAAPPLNTPEAREAVYAAMEAQVRALHPGEAARMFANSADQLQFRQSLRAFFTNPSTTLIPDSNAAWKSMVPNTGAWRDGACRPGSRFRPRYKVGGPKEGARTGVDSNFANTADILAPPAGTK